MFILTDEGVVFTLGDNQHGQQGIPSSTVLNEGANGTIADRIQQISLATFFFERGLKVEDVACGDYFTVFVTKEGIFGAGNSMKSEMGSYWASDPES
jgi:alpha-tubulin suppressor-like RCC1 family protein